MTLPQGSNSTSNQTASLITIIFNKSFTTGIVPDTYRFHYSHLVFFKILESVMYKRLTSFNYSGNTSYSHSNRFGFLNNQSTKSS